MRNQNWTRISLLFLLLLTGLGLATVSDYGSSWDENIRMQAGDVKLDYYQSLLSADWEKAREIAAKADNYPGFFDLNLALLREFFPVSDILTGHVFSLAFGLVAVAGAMRMAGLLGGSRAAFLTGLVLALTPSFYGHMFINPKDIPFACGYIWGLYWIAVWIRQWPRPETRTILLAGLCIGIAMATRVGGLILLCYLGLFILTAWGINLGRGAYASNGEALTALLRRQILPATGVAVLSFLVLALYWPSLQGNPFSRTGETLAATANHAWDMPVFFEGKQLTAGELPWYYILKMLLLKIPVGFLLLFAGGCFLALRIKRREGFKDGIHDTLPRLLVLFSIFFPLGYVIVRDSTLYNGIRHLIFILPPAAVLCGLAADRALEILKDRADSFRTAVIGLSAAYCLLLAFTGLRLHPYQYIYYNEIAGGVARAQEDYETDYWGTAYRELAESFYDFLVSTRASFNRPYVVVNMEHVTWLFEPYLPAESKLPIHVLRSRPQDDDFYAATPLWNADRFYHGRPVVTIERMGVPLGVVKDRRGLSPEERGFGYAPDFSAGQNGPD